MKRRFIFLLLLALFLFGFSHPRPTTLNNVVAGEDDLQSLRTSLALFSEELLPYDDANPIISPLGLYINLSMMAETVSDDIKQDIFAFLGLESINDLRELNRVVITAYTDNSLAKEFKLKNFLFRDTGVKNDNLYNEELIGEMKSNYSLEDVIINLLQEGPAKISKTIKDATNDFLIVPEEEIANFLHQYSVNVLMNIIYFNDEWSDKFTKSEVKDIDFAGQSGQNKKVKGLAGQRVGLYYKDENCVIGTLSFNKGCKIYFILPDEDKTVGDVIASGVIKDIAEYKLEFQTGDIDYKIPKFDITYQYDMTDILKEKGLEPVFSPQLDSPFYLGEIFQYEALYQSSRIVLDEAGVKAATATMSFGCGAKSAPPRIPVTVHLERPFIYLIATPQNIILFSGIINNL